MRRTVIVFVCSVWIVALIIVGLYTGLPSNFFSDEQHMQRITKRAEERFLGEDSEYTGLEVYPIYNEYDKLKYALIEFEPQGFVYVYISEREYPWSSMYSLSDTESESWIPYRVKEGAQEEIVDIDGKLYGSTNCEYIRDENGQVIIYKESHFKVAGIENERRYFLSTACAVLGYTDGLIPAVKCGEKYLDLVDGALIDYTPGMKSTYAIAELGFIKKAHCSL